MVHSLMIICCCYFQVIASHPYEGEDEDELSFDKGTTVLVIPYDDPEDEVSVRCLDGGLGFFHF